MVHNNMVKVVSIVHARSANHIDADASIAEMESETDSRQRSTASELWIGCGMAHSMYNAIYIAQS